MAKTYHSLAATRGGHVSRPRAQNDVVGRAGLHDPRWPALAAALLALREKGRHAVRIVDADCGAGGLLLQALRHARTLGFTAIEGRGIDGSPNLVARARAAASRAPDPAIGAVFEVADMVTALEEEFDLPADIVLWRGADAARARPGIVDVVFRAGDLIVSDRHTISSRNAAA